MPRKRSSKVSLTNKQKKLITTRLMQISLKVDDFIYHNKPLSEKSASMLLKEVAGYEDKCYGDRPSLQVIEKLTRVMKSIIAEQQELRSCGEATDYNITSVEGHSIVAPSVDENLTQLTQNFHFNMNLQTPNNNNEVIDISDEENHVENINLIGKETNNVHNEKKDNKNVKTQVMTISKIKIEDENSAVINLQTACSQSILNSYECFNDVDDGTRTGTSKTVLSQDFEKDIRPLTIDKEYLTTLDKNANLVSAKKANELNYLKPNIVQKPVSQNQNVKQVPRRKRGPNKKPKGPKICKDANHDNEKRVVKRKTRHTKGVENKINRTRKNHELKTIPVNIDITKLPNIPALTKWPGNSYDPAHCAQQDYSMETIKTTNLQSIYSKNIENDLSWIENVRYVREVTQEEYVPAILEDTFWENYTLASDWNDDDFLYT